jgi:hypothetical protein
VSGIGNTTHEMLHIRRCDFCPSVIKFTCCLPYVGGTPASFTAKTGHHDIAELLLKLDVRHPKINKEIVVYAILFMCYL